MVRIDQFTRLVKVVVDNRLWVDSHCMIDGGKDFGRVYWIFNRSGSRFV